MPATNRFRRPQSILAFSLLLAAADCADDPSASNGECDRPPLQTFVFYDLSGNEAVRILGPIETPDEFLLLGRYVASGAYKTRSFAQYKADRPTKKGT